MSSGGREGVAGEKIIIVVGSFVEVRVVDGIVTAHWLLGSKGIKGATGGLRNDNLEGF